MKNELLGKNQMHEMQKKPREIGELERMNQ